jgi:DNA-binding IclR family transcriptional regulator
MKPATSIEKVCRVLAAFRSRPSLGITEVAQHTALLPSDVHRILRSLEHFGYVSQDDETRKYRLGLELLKLGDLVHERLELREVARPFMRRLTESTRATASLAVYDDHDLEIVFVEQIDSPEEMQIRRRLGMRVWAHATAVGKVLLAGMNRATARRVLKKHGMPRRTRNTICDAERMERELDIVRDQGYSTDHEEGLQGVTCFGAPVQDHRSRVVAALAVSVVSAQVSNTDESRLITAVKRTAAEISAALGCELPAKARRPRAKTAAAK